MIQLISSKKISDLDFNVYYTIDRTLFYRLVHKLGRNVIESMHVVAFLTWLEKIGYSHNAVLKVIAWPFHLLDQLANEIAGFLRCLERKEIGREYICLHSVRKLCSLHIDLFEFHAKRIEILESVRNIVSVVCIRAFKDILTCDSEFVDVEGDRMWDAHNNLVIEQPPFYNYVGGGFTHLGFRGNFGSGNFMAPANNVQNVLGDTNADLSEMLGCMQLGNSCQDPDGEPDDRTIFLTFSKGCYIPEMEIREFFTRYYFTFGHMNINSYIQC